MNLPIKFIVKWYHKDDKFESASLLLKAGKMEIPMATFWDEDWANAEIDHICDTLDIDVEEEYR